MRLVFIAVLASACGATQDRTNTRRDAILAGQADSTSSVFLLDLRFSGGDAAICSAVLITPRVLLTAAHCVEPALHASTSVVVKATNKPDDTDLHPSDFTDVTVVTRHPQWSATASNSPYDLAALLLATPSGVAPTPIARALPADLPGRTIRIVGYGRTAAGTADSGTRRTQSVPVSTLTSDLITFGTAGASGICSGDSGGPALFTGADLVERVAGIHSLTRSSQCGLGDDIRVDQRLPFIDGFVTTNDPATCARDARCATGCTPVDPDCPTDCAANGVCASGCAAADPDCVNCGVNSVCSTIPCPTPDLDCTPNCGADGVCASGTCPQPDVDCANCGANGVCSTTGCAARDPDCLDDGTVCTAAAECAGQQCVADPRGFSFCSRTCATTGECQLDMVCVRGACRAQPQAVSGVRGGCAASPGLLCALALLGLRRNRRRRAA